MNLHGTFYEVPRDDSGGLAKARPIATHNRQIFDFASWRGMLVMSGVTDGAAAGGHSITSDDGKVDLWLGNVEDLWKLGPPRGEGGPWRNATVRAGNPSDPYLMTRLRSQDGPTLARQAGGRTFHVGSRFPCRRHVARLSNVCRSGGPNADPRFSPRILRPLGSRQDRHQLPGDGLAPVQCGTVLAVGWVERSEPHH